MNLIPRLILIFTVFLQLAVFAEEEWRYEWRDKALIRIESLDTDSNTEIILNVGRLAALRGRDAKVSTLSAEVADAAIEKLLSFPKLSTKFETEIRRLEEQERAYHEEKKSHFANSGYDRGKVFRILEYLPSPQIVGLMGELLDDPVLPWNTRKPMPGAAPYGSNSELAARTLRALPILNPPVAREPRNPRERQEDIEQWRIWRDQIKAGMRTLRFEGDPRTYNFEGLVKTTAVTSGPPKRERAPVSPSAVEQPSRTNWLPAGLATLLLLVAAGWYLKSRKAGE